MSTQPKISIVTPSYNQGDYIEETIVSVLDQNYKNIEYIIIDGGSTDNTVNIIKKYDKYLKYWETTPDNGMYHAIQKGFDKCSGSIMSWINSDDKYVAGCFETVSQIFNDFQQIEWITGSTANIDEKSRIINTRTVKTWDKFDFFLRSRGFIQQEGTFWRKGLWQKAGSYISQEYKLASDMELWARFFNIALLFSVDAPLGLFRYRSSNQKTVESAKDYLLESEIIRDSYLTEDQKKEILFLHNNFKSRFRKFFVSNKYRKIRSKNNIVKLDRKLQKFIISDF